MLPSYLSFPPLIRTIERVQWHDGKVFAVSSDGKYVITSPNMDFIPHPVVGSLRVSLMADGHFGSADPIHWPQLLRPDTKYIWLSVVQKRPQTPNDPRLAMWRVLRVEDFEKQPQCELGVVSSTVLDKLRLNYENALAYIGEYERTYGPHPTLSSLIQSMEQAFSRLGYPATFRDMVRQHACMQRYWLYTLAWLDWHVCHKRTYPLTGVVARGLHRLVGGITTSPVVAQQLFDAEVPVWIMRPGPALTSRDILERLVQIQPPCALLEFSSLQERDAYSAQLSGKTVCVVLAGDSHIEWINRQATQYADLIPNPSQLPTIFDASIPAEAGLSLAGPSLAGPSLAGPSLGASSAVIRDQGAPSSREPKASALPQKDARYHPCKFGVILMRDAFEA